MGFFSKLFGTNKAAKTGTKDFILSSDSKEKKDFTFSKDKIYPDPIKIVNRINEISWSDWNNNPRPVIDFPKTPVVGVTFNNKDGVSRQNILEKMIRWETVDIIRDKNNPHDANAVGVYSGMGQIGHIKADQAKRIAALLDSGCTPLAKLSGLYGGQEKPYGCYVDIHLLIPENAIHLKFNIVGISGKNSEGESRQDCASTLSEGDFVSLDMDYDSATTPSILADGPSGEFGKLSSKDAAKFAEMQALDYMHIAVVDSVSGDEKIKIVLEAVFWK